MITQIDKNEKKKSDWNELNVMNYSSLKEVNEMIKVIIEGNEKTANDQQAKSRER